MLDLHTLGLSEGKGFAGLDDVQLAQLAIAASHASFGVVAGVGAANKAQLHTELSWRARRGPEFANVLASASVNRHLWQTPYNEVARAKRIITGRTGLDSGLVVDERPELLLPTDEYKYRGAVLVDFAIDGEPVGAGVMGSSSGVQSVLDEEVSRHACGLFVSFYRLRAQERAGK